MTNPLLDRLRHHVTGAIERGEAQAIVEQTKELEITVYGMIGDTLASNPRLAETYDVCLRSIDIATGEVEILEEYEDLTDEAASDIVHKLELKHPRASISWD